MVYEITLRGERYYACGECGLIYEAPTHASLCEDWCRAHRTCNTSIAKHSIGHLKPYTRSLRMQGRV
ncbi:MAG: hypothetical protein F7B18_05125 [Desulfurococcales archaeon]|nr:hypothetical protein [Desulfurococcales archaeon]